MDQRNMKVGLENIYLYTPVMNDILRPIFHLKNKVIIKRYILNTLNLTIIYYMIKMPFYGLRLGVIHYKSI